MIVANDNEVTFTREDFGIFTGLIRTCTGDLALQQIIRAPNAVVLILNGANTITLDTVSIPFICFALGFGRVPLGGGGVDDEGEEEEEKEGTVAAAIIF